jgi:7-carboxy-7-deazaguanine synthase
MLKLARQGVYWTIQGEGALVGEPMVFIRLAGCSVACPACDTNYSFWRECSAAEIASECLEQRYANNRARYAWVTGGEPTDQDIEPLMAALWSAGFIPCLATSGIRPVSADWGWVSVSPHSTDFRQRRGDEIKVVPMLNGLDISAIDHTTTSFRHQYVQPMVGNRESLAECLDWVRHNEDWSFSPQCHKSWGLP